MSESFWKGFYDKYGDRSMSAKDLDSLFRVPYKDHLDTVIYVAGKYRGETEWEQACNISHAGYIARELWKKGYAVICPHKNVAYFGGVLSNPKDDWMMWIKGDLEILSRCDAIYMLKGWHESDGAKLEYHHAKELGLRVYFEEQGDLIK